MSPFQSSIRANYPLRSVSVRRPTAAEAAWYTRGRRAAIWVTTSHVFVVRVRARSSAEIALVALRAEEHEFVVGADRRPGHVGDVDHAGVHRHVADERHAPAAHERLGRGSSSRRAKPSP